MNIALAGIWILNTMLYCHLAVEHKNQVFFIPATCFLLRAIYWIKEWVTEARTVEQVIARVEKKN